MTDHLDNIRPDQDEIRVKHYNHRHHVSMSGVNIGTAIVLAAIIGIGGYWGGKLGYELIQEKRLENALKQATQEMNAALQREEYQRQQRIQAARRQAQEQAARAEQARKEEIWNSRACKFWWEHDPHNPAVIAKARTMQTCQG